MNNILNEIDLMVNKINMDDAKYNNYYNILTISLTNLINNKIIFKRNSEVVEFLECNFNFQYPDYVKKTRMLILGRTIQNIYKIKNTNDLKKLVNKSYELLSKASNGEDIKTASKSWSETISKLKIGH